ncbi:MFS transporter [Primorskyibacter sp. S87]|uniref:MFS transporter n=1 Tax=Primorskyibacter sp. S87 TaxID=3415126 RepID=UPI003C7A1394
MSTNKNYGWFVVGTTLVNQSLSMGILLAGFALFVVPWVEEFQVARSQVLLGSTFILVVNSLLSPFAGRLMDRLSLRTLILLGVVCLAAGLVLISIASSFWMILVAYATLLPVSLVMCGSLSSQTLVSKWFTEGRGFALGISSLGSSIGGFILPAVISALIVAFSWRQALIILAVVCLVTLIPLNGIILRKEPPKPVAEAEGEREGEQPQESAEPLWTTGQVVRMPMFWIPVLGIIPLMAGFTGVQFNLGAYVSDLQYDQSLAAQLITVAAIGQVVGKLAAGSLSEKVDHRIIYWVMAIMMGAAMYLFSGGPSQSTLYLAAALMGGASGATLPMLPIMYSSRFGTRSIGIVLGFVTLVLVVGSFGSLFAGLIYDATQSYDMAFLIFGALLVPVSILMAFLPSPDKARKKWPE